MTAGRSSMRALARVGTRTVAVEVTRRSGGATVTLDDRTREVTTRRRGASILITTKSAVPAQGEAACASDGEAAGGAAVAGGLAIDAVVVRAPGATRAYSVVLRGRTYTVTFDDPLRPAAGAARGAATAGRAEIRSVMPGKVRAILVKQGDRVGAGQGLVVIEAMKMENEIPSPKDGRVVSIAVAVGDAVEAGQLLGVVE